MTTETTDQELAEELTIEDRIVVLDSDFVDEDVLYDVRRECEDIGEHPLAARVEIERRELIDSPDEYDPVFVRHELRDIAMAMHMAKRMRTDRGEMHRVERIQNIANVFLDDLEFEEDGVQ